MASGMGGMEDYRRYEQNPMGANGAYSIGLEEYRKGSDVTDKSRADRLRERFLVDSAKGGNDEHSAIRHSALSRALLSTEQVKANHALVCGMSPENRRQLIFTVALIFVSLWGTIMSTVEQRFVGHLGKDSMAARSISFSVIMYFYGISSMWAAISTKIGRAVGAKDYAAIGKYFKMAMRLGLGSGIFAMALIYPFGPYVMKHLYLEGKPHVYSMAVEYLYIHTVGMSLDYLCGVGSGVVQGMQQLKYYCFLGAFESTFQGFSNWLAINVLVSTQPNRQPQLDATPTDC